MGGVGLGGSECDWCGGVEWVVSPREYGRWAARSSAVGVVPPFAMEMSVWLGELAGVDRADVIVHSGRGLRLFGPTCGLLRHGVGPGHNKGEREARQGTCHWEVPVEKFFP